MFKHLYIYFKKYIDKWPFIRFNGMLRAYFLLGTILFYQGFNSVILAQETGESVAEKIYLQLSNKDYTTDQTIWFKAIVANSKNHLPTTNSGILYVDLIAPNKQIITHKLIKLSKGIGSGAFELENNYEAGHYLIRAYTQWNRNFGVDFMFKTYVRLHKTTTPKQELPKGDFSIVEQEEGSRNLRGTILRQTPYENSKKQIQVILDWKSGQDTLRFKGNKNQYTIDYPLPKDVGWVNLTILEEGGSRTNTIILPNAKPDLQFFPESGNVMYGFKNKVGFKAVGFDGKGIEVLGELQDLEGNKITEFKSNHLEMGMFIFEPDSSKQYQIMASFPKNGDSVFNYTLPIVKSIGSVLSINRIKENIHIEATSNEIHGKVFIRISCRGKDYYMIEGPLRHGKMVSKLASNVLPDGILSFTLMDSQKITIAERLYYNESNTNQLNVVVRTDEPSYVRRQKTNLEIAIPQNDTLVLPTNLSVLVLKKEEWNQKDLGNIRSYFLLGSELRGEVEEIGHYFKTENKNKHEDMDALLLTQGWRKYKYPTIHHSSTFFWPEKSLIVKGTAISTSGRKTRNQKVDITLAAFGEKSILYTQQTDSMGRFQFELDDYYGPQTKLLLSAKNIKNTNSNYNISLALPSVPKIDYKVTPEIKTVTRIQKALITSKERRNRTNTVFDSLYGVTQLDEVVVEDYRLTPLRKQAYQEFGEPNLVIKGDMIRKKEKKWSFGLFSILMFNYGDQIRIEQFSDGFMLAQIIAGSEPTLLAVDGQLIAKSLYSFAPIMSSEIIESVELIKYAKNFRNQYMTVFPGANNLTAPRLGHIISIYTKGNVGMTATGKPPAGTLNYVMQSFSPTTEFYTPKYDVPISSGEDQPDLRSIIHWEPSITLNSDRKTLSFYNGDISGNYVIIVEAISADGSLVYQQLFYTVED